jgi:hypothetical protein
MPALPGNASQFERSYTRDCYQGHVARVSGGLSAILISGRGYAEDIEVVLVFIGPSIEAMYRLVQVFNPGLLARWRQRQRAR